MIYAGQQFAAGVGITTALPTFDFEGFSAAGYRWAPELQKWKQLEGLGDHAKRGLECVGTRNWVCHPSFDITSLVYDLLDGKGERHWYPRGPVNEWGVVQLPRWPDTPAVFGNGHSAHPAELLRHIINGGMLSAWYVSMEWTVWNHFCVPKWGWPRLPIEQLVCDLSKSRAHAYPGGLGNAAKVMHLVSQKDADGDRLLKKFSVPRNPTKKDKRWRIRPEEDPADAQRLYAYNGTDVRTEIEASLRTPDLLPFERDIWLTDQAVNQRGIGVDVPGIQNCIAVWEQAEAKYTAELRALTASAQYPYGYVQEASEVEKTLEWLHACGLKLNNLDEEAVSNALQVEWLHPYAKRVLRIRQMIGGAAVKKLYAFLHQQHDGRIHDMYGYFGARTGRWNAHGAQPMNLYKGVFPIKGCPGNVEAQTEEALRIIALRDLAALEAAYPDHDAGEIIASCIRGLIVAGPDHDLVCSDFSAIEGVVTAALAGEEWRLEVFRTHGLIYEQTAADICGIPFDDFVKHRLDTGGVATYAPDGTLLGIKDGKHHPQRALQGKFGELSSGFGGWIGAWKRFGADEHMSDEEIKRAILKWRSKSPMIEELWGGQVRNRFRDSERPELFGLEGAIISAIRQPGQAYCYRDIVYQMHGDVLYCRVPSGGFITYHAPRLSTHNVSGERRGIMRPYEVCISYEGWNSNPQMGPVGWVRMDLYGGKATENVVQRVARDIQAHALVNLERRHYRPVLHSHDEIAGEVREGWGSVEEFEEIANDIPSWARTRDGRPWPVRMKGGWRGHRYRKD